MLQALGKSRKITSSIGVVTQQETIPALVAKTFEAPSLTLADHREDARSKILEAGLADTEH